MLQVTAPPPTILSKSEHLMYTYNKELSPFSMFWMKDLKLWLALYNVPIYYKYLNNVPIILLSAYQCFRANRTVLSGTYLRIVKRGLRLHKYILYLFPKGTKSIGKAHYVNSQWVSPGDRQQNAILTYYTLFYVIPYFCLNPLT